ncbi:MAG TPA: DMT family transporter [Candidatus Sulfotelmatobacter sp.]|nr:DMT family transporter [Candidatus Sulfotelmatobacter sp.]
MLLGLGSALGFGLADLFGAVSTRRLGVPQTLLIIQVLSVATLSLVLLTPAAGSLSPSFGVRIAIVAGGTLGIASYFSFFRALELGPVAIVSPVFASYAALTVIFSIVFNGERLSALAALGIALTIAGVALASARGEARRGTRGGGIPFALLAMMAWGVASYLLGRAAQQTGWFFPLYGARLAELVGAVGVAIFLGVRGVFGPPPGGRSILLACASGMADNAGVAAFVRGSQLGLVSITSAVSASFPLIVIAGSLILFGERPSPRQWVGILAAIAGLILLGLGR